MPGEIVSGPGDSAESWENFRSDMPTVTLETEFFMAEAIPLYAMPGMRVLDAMVSPEAMKMIKMFDLFKLALTPEKQHALEVLTFQELNGIMAQWIRKSNEKEMGADGNPEADSGFDFRPEPGLED